MKQKIIGTYEIGYDQVQLILRDGTGGEFYLIPERGSLPRIKIGAECKYWRDIVAVLLHESAEFIFERIGARWNPSGEVARDHAAYLFSFDHTKFGDMCAKQAEFITCALPDLAAAWKKWNKNKK